MTKSSFYADGETYDTAVVTSNDVPASTTPSQAPSAFYPGGTVYDTLADSDVVLAQLAADLAASQAAKVASELAASNSAADAALSHQAYLDALVVLSTSLLKANNLSDLTNTATARANIGLGNVDNTSDANKPVSTAQATADALVASNAATANALKANTASPTLTGVPAAPTAAPGTNTTQLATTAFVEAARVILAAADALKAPLASPTFTGVPAGPTATAGTNTTQFATTAFVEAARVILAAADALKAPLASPTLTGVPAAPTAAAGTNTTQLATTAFVEAARVILVAATALKADLASPALTGTPTAPTATVGTNTTQLATTAFVLANGGSGGSSKPNRIVNGAMMVSQEWGTTAVTNTGYPVDEFLLSSSNTGTQTAQQVASVTPGGSPNRLRVVCTATDTSIAASDYCGIFVSIEGLRVSDLAAGSASAKTITIQFGVKAPAGTYCVAIRNGALNRAYVAEYVVSAGEANTDVVKTVTIALDQSGTWLKDTGQGLRITWALSAGTTFHASPNTWTATASFATSSQFNLLGTISNTFELFDVGVYEGSTAPAYQLPDYANELRLCLRYFETGIEPGFYLGGGYTATSGYGSLQYVEPKRAAPTVTAVAQWQYWSGGGAANFTPTFSVGSTTHFQWQPTGMTNWNGWIANGTWKASARL